MFYVFFLRTIDVDMFLYNNNPFSWTTFPEDG